ncbi:cysteine synthase family protein [Ktedonosporobacter rubrisoli]|uniref:Cysteine synthase family protein n=1 Tax=Ktedonosporobacter rubrisoli TaxID=2509675 RepID=A0A4P6JNJ7_KTERU|nr:cysteine synthase family protein [Ktedonosporobacter rubrisoli]QBD76815.1 cysteine synthase family protein [Ktedonosporobacter rubrisoli]
MRFANILETIGNTPLVELKSFSPRPGLHIFAKLEGVNPSGSIKDRIAKKMIEQAETQHLLMRGSILLEPTSGNTGVALALVARLKGYAFTAVISDKGTQDKRRLLELYGAGIITSPGAAGSNGAVRLAQKLVEQDARYVMLYQYGNQANAAAHYETTAPEIIKDLPDINVFVGGLGTGGTLTGVARRLKQYNPAIRIVAAEPIKGDSIQGLRNLADGFVPPVLDTSMLDARLLVSSQDAWRRTRQLQEQEGILAGPSSGAVLEVALRTAEAMQRGNLVIMLADGGWKYLSEERWITHPALQRAMVAP